MTPLIEIGLDATALLTVVGGSAGLLLSLGLLFFPEHVRRLNTFLSRSYQVKERLAYFDREITNAPFVYRKPLIYGALMAVGSAVTLVFLFFQMDVDRLLGALDIQGNRRLLWEMALEAMTLTGKIAGGLGLLLGLFLMIAPASLQRFESRLNTWIATQSLVDRLDDHHDTFDGLAFRRPMLTGGIGALLSIILIVLSLFSFF